MKRKEQTPTVAPIASVAKTAAVEPKQSSDAPVIDYSSPDMADAKVSEKPAVAVVAPVETPARSESRPQPPPPKA